MFLQPSDAALEAANQLWPVHRIALAYAPKQARAAWLALFLLEQKLAETARPGREPLMIQLRLAWWRDRLGEEASRWPVSEPVLSALKNWRGHHGKLLPLVDGWEASAVAEDGEAQLAHGRVAAFLALAELLGAGPAPAVTAAGQACVGQGTANAASLRVPRLMRPLAVLRALAEQEAGEGQRSPFAGMLRVMRAGLLGT
jgi:15-cis-phytoene synthase